MQSPILVNTVTSFRILYTAEIFLTNKETISSFFVKLLWHTELL